MGISIGLLEGFELSVHGQVIELPLAAQRLVAFLALNQRPLRRIYIAGVLWAETTEDRAAARLRSTLWRLRRLSSRFVVVGTTQLRLGPDVRIDVWEVSQTLNELAYDSDDLVGHLRRLPLTAELLPDWYDDWIHFERERYRQFRLHTLEKICERLHAQRCFAEAIQVALAAIAAEPLRDTAHRLLVKAYLSEGNRSEAVREFSDYREILYRELGVRSAPEIESLITSAVGVKMIKRTGRNQVQKGERVALRDNGSRADTRRPSIPSSVREPAAPVDTARRRNSPPP